MSFGRLAGTALEFVFLHRMFSEVIELIRKEEVSLFIGAGFSLKAGAPSARALTCAIREAAVEKVSGESAKEKLSKVIDLSSISQEYVEICGGVRTQLYQILEAQFSFNRGDISDQELLSQIPNIRRIFTTNYDSLIEDSYGDRAQVIRYDDDVASINHKKVNIFKIHGDLSAKENIIITKHDYTEFFSQRKNKGLWNLVQTEFLSQNILFIGYSLEDENILTFIEKVREYAPNSTKKIYLLALNLEDYKQERLERLNIKYYNAKAEQFLQELQTELCDKMTRDFENGNVSYESYTKFLNERGLRADVSENKVRNVSFIGPRKEYSIKINTTKEVHDRILNYEMSPIQIGKTVDGFGDMPRNMVGIEISANDISGFDYSMNDVTIKDGHDLKSLLIIPRINKMRVKIQIPDCHMTRKVDFYVFRTSPTSYRYSFANDLFQLDITVDKNENDDVPICHFSIDENEHFNNLNEARFWCDFLLAIFSGNLIFFKGIFKQGVKIKRKEGHIQQRYQMLSKYIDNLIYLEDSESEIEFSRYDQMTQINFIISEMLYYYVSEEINTVDLGSQFDLSFNLEKPNSLPEVGENYAFTFRERNRKIIDFNGYSTTIPYAYEIYPNCQVMDIIKTSEDSVTLKLKSNMNVKYYQFTDAPIELRNEEGPVEVLEL